jgi:outer membrane protein OmpA-like peptidoglycan-associated protein
VQQLPDVRTSPVVVPPVVTDGPGARVVAAGFTLPAERVDAGCVIRYQAPGGCLGAVRITGATIPAVTIPRTVVPATTLPEGGRVAPQLFPAVSVPAVHVPAQYTPAVCQVRRHRKVLTVTRAGVVRRGAARNGAARPGGVRPRSCDGHGCVPAVRVPTVKVPPVRLPDVDVAPARLASRKLPGPRGVKVFTGDGRTSFVVPGDVLFDTDEAAIRPDAAKALGVIAARIRAVAATGSLLLVEGHTDDRGPAWYGLVLSRRRARSVAGWLVGHAHVPADRIRTRGLGEADPAVPNTSAANRQLNRRVVITVLAGGH